MTNPLALASDAIEQLLAKHRAEDELRVAKKEVERQERVLSLVTHDLRAPLTAAKACAQLIESRLEDSRYCKSVAGRIVNAMDRGDRMIHDFLDAHRVRSGLPYPIRRQACNLTEIASKTIEEMNSLHR